MSTLMMPAPTMACAPPIAVGPHKPPGEQRQRKEKKYKRYLAKKKIPSGFRLRFELNQIEQNPNPNPDPNQIIS